MSNPDDMAINLTYGWPLLELVAGIFCLSFGAAFLAQGIESSALSSVAISASLFLLGAIFVKKLLLGPRFSRINLQSGEVTFTRGWPFSGAHSVFSLLDFRRVYILAARPVGTYQLNVIDHLGKEQTLATHLTLSRAKQVSELISKRLGLTNDSLIG